jgi:hypothetical protein
MIRAAIYVRFFSDMKSDRSIDDQVALCREVCAREGMAVVSTFEDRAISGSSAINRPGFQALLRATEVRAFDVIVAEDVDRISRDLSDWHAARKRLDFLGVTIHVASGKVGKIDGALRADGRNVPRKPRFAHPARPRGRHPRWPPRRWPSLWLQAGVGPFWRTRRHRRRHRRPYDRRPHEGI